MAGVMIASMSVPAFAQQYTLVNGGTVVHVGEPTSVKPLKTVDVDDGNGRWDYGTSLTITAKKKVWSNLDHNTKTHRSSCEIDGNYDDSGWVKRVQHQNPVLLDLKNLLLTQTGMSNKTR